MMPRRKNRKATSKKGKPSAQPKSKPTTLVDAIREALPRMSPEGRAWCEKLLAGDEAERKEAQAAGNRATAEGSVTSEQPVTQPASHFFSVSGGRTHSHVSSRTT
jgi:hypothetical protein